MKNNLSFEELSALQELFRRFLTSNDGKSSFLGIESAYMFSIFKSLHKKGYVVFPEEYLTMDYNDALNSQETFSVIYTDKLLKLYKIYQQNNNQ